MAIPSGYVMEPIVDGRDKADMVEGSDVRCVEDCCTYDFSSLRLDAVYEAPTIRHFIAADATIAES